MNSTTPPPWHTKPLRVGEQEFFRLYAGTPNEHAPAIGDMWQQADAEMVVRLVNDTLPPIDLWHYIHDHFSSGQAILFAGQGAVVVELTSEINANDALTMRLVVRPLKGIK